MRSRTWPTIAAVVAAAAALFLGGCSSVYSPPSGDPPSEEYLSQDPPERTWDAVVSYFATNNIPVKNELKGETVWTVFAEQPEFKSGYLAEYVDFGSIDGEPVTDREGQEGVTIAAAATYNVTMQKQSDGQRLTVNTTWTGTYTGPGKAWNPMAGSMVQPLQGVSKGRLEEEVLRDIRSRLRELRSGGP